MLRLSLIVYVTKLYFMSAPLFNHRGNTHKSKNEHEKEVFTLGRPQVQQLSVTKKPHYSLVSYDT